MNSTKTFLLALLVLVVGGVIGYFIGHGAATNQAASVYGINATQTQMTGKSTGGTKPCGLVPTDPCPLSTTTTGTSTFSSIYTYTNTATACINSGGTPDKNAQTDGPFVGKWRCAFLAATTNNPLPIVNYTTSEGDCAWLGGHSGGTATLNGIKVWICNLIVNREPGQGNIGK
jgi:hypothetical protein